MSGPLLLQVVLCWGWGIETQSLFLSLREKVPKGRGNRQLSPHPCVSCSEKNGKTCRLLKPGEGHFYSGVVTEDKREMSSGQDAFSLGGSREDRVWGILGVVETEWLLCDPGPFRSSVSAFGGSEGAPPPSWSRSRFASLRGWPSPKCGGRMWSCTNKAAARCCFLLTKPLSTSFSYCVWWDYSEGENLSGWAAASSSRK